MVPIVHSICSVFLTCKTSDQTSTPKDQHKTAYLFNLVCHYILCQIHPVWTENTMTASYVTDFELASALRWQMEMGVDTALIDTPAAVDRPTQFGLIDAKITQPSAPIEQTKAAGSVLAPLVPAASDLAMRSPDLSAVHSLTDLKQALEAFDGCALKKTASNLVF